MNVQCSLLMHCINIVIHYLIVRLSVRHNHGIRVDVLSRSELEQEIKHVEIRTKTKFVRHTTTKLFGREGSITLLDFHSGAS